MRLDAEESYRVARIRIAHYLGMLPAQVDSAPQRDIEDILAVMDADMRLSKHP